MTRRRNRKNKMPPVTMDYFQSVSTDSENLLRYDADRLRPSSNADQAAQDVAAKVIDLMDVCPLFQGRFELSGSSARGVRLKKPTWSDVDIVCFIRSYNGREVNDFEHFDKIRWGATDRIKGWLEAQSEHYPVFDEQEVDQEEYARGFVIKLRVKRSPFALNPWTVEILFAYDALDYNNNVPHWTAIESQLQELPWNKRQYHTNSFAQCRNAFLLDRYAVNPSAFPLVRAIKAWNCILTMGRKRPDCVSSFFFEVLVLTLLDNDVIPEDFDLAKGLATCLYALAKPSKVPALFFGREFAGGDASDRPDPPDQCELDTLREKAGPDALVLVDPFAPFNNVAHRKNKQEAAWGQVRLAAAQFLYFLKANGVTPYYNFY